MMLQQQEEQPKKRLTNESSKVRRAIDLGYIVPNWTIEDYMRDAIDNYNWESFCIWGPKGSMKSNLLLQLGFLVYQDWDTVLQHIVFKPMDFVRITKEPGRIPFLGWDDIGVHLPRSLYYTDRDLWSALKMNWDAFRTKLNVFVCTCPNKEKIVSFMLDDLTGEVFTAKRYGDKLVTSYDFQRWMWSLNFDKPRLSRFDIVRVEQKALPGTPEEAASMSTNLPGVPKDVFKEYHGHRVALAEEARDKLQDYVMKLEGKEDNQNQKATATRQPIAFRDFSRILREAGIKGDDGKFQNAHRAMSTTTATT